MLLLVALENTVLIAIKSQIHSRVRQIIFTPLGRVAVLVQRLALAATGSFLISSYSTCVWGPQFSHPMPTNFSCPSPPAMCVRAECHLISVWRHVLTFLLVWGRCSSAWGTGYREVLSEEHASFIQGSSKDHTFCVQVWLYCLITCLLFSVMINGLFQITWVYFPIPPYLTQTQR